MNHTVEKTCGNVISGVEIREEGHRQPYVIVGAMFVYTILLYGQAASGFGAGALVLLSVAAYFLTIYLYYGVARLAYLKRTYLLWTGGTLAFVAGYLVSGLSAVWPLLTGWSMVLVAGAITGRLTRDGQGQQRVYVLGLLAVVVLAVAQFAPLWRELMVAASQSADEMIEKARQSLLGMGYGADAVRDSLGGTRRMFDVVVRLIPAMTVMGAVMQFSVGYLAFVYLLGTKSGQAGRLAPFVSWKIPFGITPVLIVAILARVFGAGDTALAADNVLAFLAVYYAVAGLSLTEFYLRRLGFSKLMKIVFYLVLFFTQVVGFFVAVLIGFVDSFADWRKVQQVNTARE